MSTLYDRERALVVAGDAIEQALEEGREPDAALIEEHRLALMGANEKRDGLAYYLKSLDADVEFLDREIALLQARKRSRENLKKRLCSFILGVMQGLGIEKVSGNAHTLSVVKNPPSVWVRDGHPIPDEYARIVPEHREWDKKKALDALKQGKDVPGAGLNEPSYRLGVR